MKRYSYLRQFAPSLLDHLTVDLEPTGSPALLEALTILRDLNRTGRRTLPAELPIACIPKRFRPFVGPHGTRNRRAYECAVLTALAMRSHAAMCGCRVVGALASSRISSCLMRVDSPPAGLLPSRWTPRGACGSGRLAHHTGECRL